MSFLTDDCARLFAIFEAAYGATWKPKPDWLPMWRAAIAAEFDAPVAFGVAERWVRGKIGDGTFPPKLPEFLAACRHANTPPALPALPGPSESKRPPDPFESRTVERNREFGGLARNCEQAKADAIRAYAEPHHALHNPYGNQAGVRLPDSVAQRRPGETLGAYSVRIGDEVTFAQYPQLRRDFPIQLDEPRRVKPTWVDPIHAACQANLQLPPEPGGNNRGAAPAAGAGSTSDPNRGAK